MDWARSLSLERARAAGMVRAARMEMMAMTVRSSMREKARRCRGCEAVVGEKMMALRGMGYFPITLPVLPLTMMTSACCLSQAERLMSLPAVLNPWASYSALL